MVGEQWPGTTEEKWRVVRHWVTGCGADPLLVLKEMEHGMSMTYTNGFWVGCGLLHGVPVAHVPHELTRRVEPAQLVDLAMMTALHNPSRFAEACFTIEDNVHVGGIWPLLHRHILCHTSMPPLMDHTFTNVHHGGIKKFVWGVFNHLAGVSCARQAEKAIIAIMKHPIPVCSREEHAGVKALIKAGGLTLSRRGKSLGVLQYPGVSLTMTKTDHYLLVLLAAFSTTHHMLPEPFVRLRKTLRQLADDHEPTMVQVIQGAWRQGRKLP